MIKGFPLMTLPLMMRQNFIEADPYIKWNDEKWLENEYNLIQQKKSKLGANDRREVIYRYEKILKENKR